MLLGVSLRHDIGTIKQHHDYNIVTFSPANTQIANDPKEMPDEFIHHRLERERKLLAALEMGLRDRDELLDAAWDDVPWHVSPDLRRAAGVTLDAHLEKLRDEGRLPSDIKP